MAKNNAASGLSFFTKLQLITERYLSYRKRTKRIRKEKQKKKNIIIDWVGTFLWCAGMVLLINQYLFQAYVIPSGSMIDTLMVGDRVIVNKLIFGPELLPGLAKLPSPIKPQRNDIIIFENPSIISRGLAFDLAQRIIFMLTLSLVNIDVDEFGQPRPHFLIKRVSGVGGDRFIQERGNMIIRPMGESRWYDERDFFSKMGMTHNLERLMHEHEYPALEAAGRAAGYRDLGVNLPASVQTLASQAGRIIYPDFFTHEKTRLEVLRGAHPHDSRYSALLARHNQGIYVPETRLLPLGDNRDNSRDGRYFGPVGSGRILGRGSIIYWPGDFRVRGFAAFERLGVFK
ncbi:MAG: signal peptidase I [Treponema sp.]|nr:signal peptidase I [Treponema sp.]